MAVASPTSLVYYAAVAKGSVVLAEYVTQGNMDLPAIATCCLENVPPLHSRFSYTTRQRRFICILDGIFTYCAIMDEALSKADAFSFLHHIREAFRTLHKGRGPNSETVTLGAHLLDEEMVPIMRQHAAMLVGVPQRERNRMEVELQAERDAEVDPEVSSPTAVAPLDEVSDQDFISNSQGIPVQFRLQWMYPFEWMRFLITKGTKRDNSQMKDTRALDKANDVEILVEQGSGGAMETHGNMHSKEIWRLIVRCVVMLDGLICLFLLAIWLGVCEDFHCLKG